MNRDSWPFTCAIRVTISEVLKSFLPSKLLPIVRLKMFSALTKTEHLNHFEYGVTSSKRSHIIPRTKRAHFKKK